MNESQLFEPHHSGTSLKAAASVGQEIVELLDRMARDLGALASDRLEAPSLRSREVARA